MIRIELAVYGNILHHGAVQALAVGEDVIDLDRLIGQELSEIVEGSAQLRRTINHAAAGKSLGNEADLTGIGGGVEISRQDETLGTGRQILDQLHSPRDPDGYSQSGRASPPDHA